MILVPADQKPRYEDEVKRYKGEKAEIMKDAQKLEKEAQEWDARSDAALHQHHRWAQATTVIQVSIALSAIALLSRRTWLLRGVDGVGAVGLLIGGMAAIHV